LCAYKQKGVTIVISGIQHPERGQIRDKATAMGAKYLPDWNRSATHLICDFANTPKYQQAKG
jgi:DNA-repair protein XRCC1